MKINILNASMKNRNRIHVLDIDSFMFSSHFYLLHGDENLLPKDIKSNAATKVSCNDKNKLFSGKFAFHSSLFMISFQ